MRNRILISAAVTLMVAAVFSTPVFRGQDQVRFGTKAFDPKAVNTEEAIKAAAAAAKAADSLANWTPPRTPWGDPDLRGYWLTATYTPLERPKELATVAGSKWPRIERI